MTGNRVVVTDDNHAINVVVYRQGIREGHATEISPLAALVIARDLLSAALPKLEARKPERKQTDTEGAGAASNSGGADVPALAVQATPARS